MEIVYRLTKDESLLQQYHELRHLSYHNDKYMKGHFQKGLPDKYDELSEVIVAVKGKEVIGGSRLTMSSPDVPILLPSESETLTFQDMLPDIDLDQSTYGEMHRFVIAKDHRIPEIIVGLLYHSFKRMAEKSWDYLFTPSIRVKARYYRRMCKRIGINIDITSGVVLRAARYENVEMLLMKIDIRSQPLYRDIQNNIIPPSLLKM